jgi:hypothetical protein
MRRLSRPALLALSLSACDPTAMSEGSADKPAAAPAAKAEAPRPASEPPAPEASAPAPAPAKNALHECLTACDTAKMSHAERATCRMNCDPGPGGAAAGPDADGGIGQAVQCFGACQDGKAGDGKACAQACVAAGAKVANAPAQAVLEQLGACVTECHADKTLSSTDRETCKLTCSQVAATAGPGDSKAGGR